MIRFNSFIKDETQRFLFFRGQSSMKSFLKLTILPLLLISFQTSAQKTLIGQNISAHNGSNWVHVVKQEYSYFLNGDSIEMVESSFNGSTYLAVRKEFIKTNSNGDVTSYIEQTYNQNTQMLENHQKITNVYTTESTNNGDVTYLHLLTSYEWNANTQHWDTAYHEVADINNDGQIVTRTVYIAGNQQKNTLFEQVYNSNGDIDTMYISDWNTGAWHLSTRVVYSYSNPWRSKF